MGFANLSTHERHTTCFAITPESYGFEFDPEFLVQRGQELTTGRLWGCFP